jgi:L-iditol 2-dehydrogenase
VNTDCATAADAATSCGEKRTGALKVLAARFYGKEDIRVEGIELPEVDDYGMRIRVLVCGVCGSDVRYFLHGPSPRYKIPGILGHEVCGEIVEVGRSLEGYKVGSRVTLSPIIPCMSCEPCVSGLDNLCRKSRGWGNTCDGGMAQYMNVGSQAVCAGVVARIEDGVDINAAALTELVGCCLNGLEQLNVQAGQDVLIVGDGPIGLTFLQVLRSLGARTVVTVGRRKTRRELALALGASRALDAEGDGLCSLVDGSFHHVIIASAGAKQATEAFRVLRPGGSLLLFSGNIEGLKGSYDMNEIHYRQLHIHGSIDCTVRQFHLAVSLLPKLSMEKLVTGVFPLSRTKEAFYASKAEDSVKLLIDGRSE